MTRVFRYTINMIQLCDVTKQYNSPSGTVDVLNGIHLSITPETSIAITGPSGSGKSTLLRILAGMEPPSKGKVVLNNQNLYQCSDDERARIRSHTFGFIFQSFRLFDELNVLENVMLGLDIKGSTASEEKAKQWLHEVGLDHRMMHHPDTLSGGEKQRVAIARALATDPDVIIADEPTGNLDQKNSDTVRGLLEGCLKKTKAALVLVTHNVSLAAMCSTQYQLSHGQLKKTCHPQPPN